jgi:F-type H+-transporting ATPase subunit c
MKRSSLSLLCLALFVMFVIAGPVLAKNDVVPEASGTSYTFYGVAVGAGLGAAITLLGAGYGFGKIGSAALESMARQPEVANRLFTTMLLIAALLEGATFFSLIVCILILVL